MRKRLVSDIKKLLLILGAGFIYCFIIFRIDVMIPCIFNRITGWLCPGCGITRMIYALLKFNFREAYGYNKALFITLPVIFITMIWQEIKYIKTGKRELSKHFELIMWCEAAALLMFGIIRNVI